MDPPRPLADLPPLDAAVVSRAWLLARLAEAPLEAAPVLASERFAAEAPAAVEAVAAAMGGRAALDALLAQPPAVVASLGDLPAEAPSWEGGTAAIVSGVEALRRALAAALAPQLPAEERAALHDRLAHVCAALAAAALEACSDETLDITVRDHRAIDGRLIPEAGSRGPARPDPEGPAAAAAALPGRPERVDRAGLAAAAAALGGGAYCVLALEIEDASALPPGLLTAGESALRAGLPAGARFALDGPGSLLVLLPGPDGRALAQRLVAAVAAVGEHHGAPLRVAAGVAEPPRDGASLEALLAHADGQLFAARAEGLPLV